LAVQTLSKSTMADEVERNELVMLLEIVEEDVQEAEDLLGRFASNKQKVARDFLKYCNKEKRTDSEKSVSRSFNYMLLFLTTHNSESAIGQTDMEAMQTYFRLGQMKLEEEIKLVLKIHALLIKHLGWARDMAESMLDLDVPREIEYHDLAKLVRCSLVEMLEKWEQSKNDSLEIEEKYEQMGDFWQEDQAAEGNQNGDLQMDQFADVVGEEADWMPGLDTLFEVANGGCIPS
jgi:hypothetical protein